MGDFKTYRKKTLSKLRAYTPGEDLSSVNVAPGLVPEAGGMIGMNPDNPSDLWYITRQYFEANYEEATEVGNG